MRLRDSFRPWVSTAQGLKTYFQIYGGFPALALSPYVHVALLVGIPAAIFSGTRFGDTGASVLPNILGFTIGAMAIVLSVSTSDFFDFLAEKGEPKSFFMKIVANFLHYIIVQAVTIIICVLEKGQSDAGWLSYIAAVMFIYSILSPVAMGMQLFQMARLYNAKAGVNDKQKQATLPITSQSTPH